MEFSRRVFFGLNTQNLRRIALTDCVLEFCRAIFSNQPRENNQTKINNNLSYAKFN